MKCPCCDVYTTKSGPIINPFTGKKEWFTCPECGGHNWIPFWTPSERAGMKAMGFHFSTLPESVKVAIRRYVCLSMMVKKNERT